MPLTLLSGSGTFVGNQFTSNPLPQASAYNFQFEDVNQCGVITVSGPSTCNCTTAAGTMLLTPIDACESQIATATYNGGFLDDGNDLLRYIIHTNPALPLGTVLGWNTTPNFGFLPGMTFGTTYYISAIAGNSDGMGQVDLMDICIKVSQGTPVVFHALPTGDIGLSSPSVCLGDSLIINVNFTGSPSFSFTPQFGSTPQSAITGIAGSTYPLVIFPTQDVAALCPPVMRPTPVANWRPCRPNGAPSWTGWTTGSSTTTSPPPPTWPSHAGCARSARLRAWHR